MSARKPFAAGRRPLALPFINTLDAWLLKNKSGIWASRIHLIVYYLLLYALLIVGATLLISSSPTERSNIEIALAFTAIVSAIVLIVGLIYLFRFNVFKRFGDGSSFAFVRNFKIHFLSFLILISISTLPIWVERWEAHAAFPDNEMVRDINDFNLAVAVMEREHLRDYEYVDTLIVIESSEIANELSTRLIEKDIRNEHKRYIQPYELERERGSADSTIQLGKDSFHSFHHDRLLILPYNRFYGMENTEALTNMDMFHLVIRNKTTMSLKQAEMRVNEITQKYTGENSHGNYNYYNNDNDEDYYLSRIETQEKYRLKEIEYSLHNIIRRKNTIRIPNDLDDFLRGIIYSALGAALLLLAFRHSTIKLFFLSIISAVVLAFLSGLIVAALNYREDGAVGMYLFVFAVLMTLAATIPLSTKRSLVKGIALNGSMLGVFPIPVMIVALLKEKAQRAYYEMYPDYYVERPWDSSYVQPPPFDYEKWNQYMVFAEIGGFILLFGMMYFVFSKLYRSWYAQAEE